MVSMRDVLNEVGAVDCEAARPWCDSLFVLSFVCGLSSTLRCDRLETCRQ